MRKTSMHRRSRPPRSRRRGLRRSSHAQSHTTFRELRNFERESPFTRPKSFPTEPSPVQSATRPKSEQYRTRHAQPSRDDKPTEDLQVASRHSGLTEAPTRNQAGQWTPPPPLPLPPPPPGALPKSLAPRLRCPPPPAWSPGGDRPSLEALEPRKHQQPTIAPKYRGYPVPQSKRYHQSTPSPPWRTSDQSRKGPAPSMETMAQESQQAVFQLNQPGVTDTRQQYLLAIGRVVRPPKMGRIPLPASPDREEIEPTRPTAPPPIAKSLEVRSQTAILHQNTTTRQQTPHPEPLCPRVVPANQDRTPLGSLAEASFSARDPLPS